MRRLVPKASHIPELAQESARRLCRALALARADRLPSRHGPASIRRPLSLSTVLAEIPEGPPARFTWRRLTRRVAKAEGLSASRRNGGVRRCPRPRDYYRIEDEDGHRYWVFREGLYQDSELGPPSWYLHGVFG